LLESASLEVPEREVSVPGSIRENESSEATL
jgi:hypothetical protein